MAAQLTHLKLLSRTPDRLVIGCRSVSSQVLAVRSALGVVLVLVGLREWSRSWVLGLSLGLAGVLIGLPWDQGETLVVDKAKDQIRLVRPRGYWPFTVMQQTLSDVADVQVAREAVDRYAEGAMSYRCQVQLVLKSGETTVIGDYTSQISETPRELAQKMIKWIRPYL